MNDLKKIFEQISKETGELTAPNYELLETMLETDKKDYIEFLQGICNELYDKNGLTDGILNLQVYINEYRHKYDITDPREIIHTDNGKGFVQ